VNVPLSTAGTVQPLINVQYARWAGLENNVSTNAMAIILRVQYAVIHISEKVSKSLTMFALDVQKLSIL
jgi:hypothetical protein